jgi:hypothetical protein
MKVGKAKRTKGKKRSESDEIHKKLFRSEIIWVASNSV